MKIRKLSCLINAAALLLAVSANALTITSFGDFATDTFNDFTSVTAGSPSGIAINGNDLQTLSGTFTSGGTPVDLSSGWSDATSNGLVLYGSMTTAPSSTFTINLYVAADNTATFVGGSWNALDTDNKTFLSVTSVHASFDATQVYAMDIPGGGGGDTITGTLTELSTVPEPSSYAVLAGMLALGYVTVRRRR